jgi:hypothetical protein
MLRRTSEAFPTSSAHAQADLSLSDGARFATGPAETLK